MARKTEQRLLCESYCSQKRYLNTKDKTLADLIYKENSKKFKSKEHARDFVRIIRGHASLKMRKQTADKSLYKPLTYDTTNSKKGEQEVYARILILDIETAPLMARMWGIWQQNINTDNIVNDWFMLTWAAKWLFEDKVYSAKVTPKEAIENNDKRIVQSLIDMLNKADIVVTHNGDRFDLPRINTRALIHGIQPPLPYQSIDTLKVAKKQFQFTSNKLDYINKQLGLQQKTETNQKLWTDCLYGKKKGLADMEKYNINDVRIHETTYLRMRSWIKPHPNIGLYIVDDGTKRCPSCGSKEIQMSGKDYVTTANRYEAFRCTNCGSIGKLRKALKGGNKLTMSVPK